MKKLIFRFIVPLFLSYTAYSSALSPEFKNPEWGKFNAPTWPPPMLAPVVDEVPLDTYDCVLFATGIILVYVMFQRKNGRAWKEIFSFSNVCSFLASKT